MTGLAKFMGWIDEAAFPLFMVGVAIMSIPIIHFIRDLQTLFVITNRRALILRAAWTEKKTTVDSTYYERMDKELEILAISGNVGHLNFASRVSTRQPGRRLHRPLRFPLRQERGRRCGTCWRARSRNTPEGRAFSSLRGYRWRALSAAIAAARHLC